MIPDEEIDRILVVGAHPDDIDFGVAGTVARWRGRGIDVVYCVVTDGQAGGFDPSVPRDEMARLRREEQHAAAAVVGVEEVVFLGYEDGRVEATIGLRRDLARVIRQVRPDRVVMPSPRRDWDRLRASHPDHLATGEATMAAVYPDSRNPFAFPELADEEGLEAHTVREVWLVADPDADHPVEVTGTLEQKLSALACHASQIPGEGELREAVTGWLADTAARVGLGPDRHAEIFRVIDTT